jgi:phosphate transport system substrate-binding protein
MTVGMIICGIIDGLHHSCHYGHFTAKVGDRHYYKKDPSSKFLAFLSSFWHNQAIRTEGGMNKKRNYFRTCRYGSMIFVSTNPFIHSTSDSRAYAQDERVCVSLTPFVLSVAAKQRSRRMNSRRQILKQRWISFFIITSVLDKITSNALKYNNFRHCEAPEEPKQSRKATKKLDCVTSKAPRNDANGLFFIKKKNSPYFLFKIGVITSLFIQNAYGEPPLRIVGSSAVFPFAATVAEHFKYKTHEPIPLIEAVGTGAGIKLFCGHRNGPDGVMTSRPFTVKEKEKCRENGITFGEFTIGQDGLVLIQNNQSLPFSLTLKDLDQALSEKIQQGKDCHKNPYKTWKDIQPTFSLNPIHVLGPAPSSGTYDILVEKLSNSCGPLLRHDGAYIEAAANENLIVQKVLSNRSTIGIVTFSFYDQNKTRLQALPLNTIFPSVTSIQDKSYVLSRPLFLYIKTNDLRENPARRAYALEFTSPEAVGEKGYLNKKGLIPLSLQEQKKMQERANSL